MTVILKEESMTLYKDKNVFTAVVIVPGSFAAFGQVFFSYLINFLMMYNFGSVGVFEAMSLA